MIVVVTSKHQSHAPMIVVVECDLQTTLKASTLQVVDLSPCSWYSYHDGCTRIPLDVDVVWKDDGLKWLCYPSQCGGQQRENFPPGYGQLVGVPSTKEKNIFQSVLYMTVSNQNKEFYRLPNHSRLFNMLNIVCVQVRKDIGFNVLHRLQSTCMNNVTVCLHASLL